MSNYEISTLSEVILRDRYMQDGMESPLEVIERAAYAFSSTPKMAERMINYVLKKWVMFSTPVLSNAPERASWSDNFEENFSPTMFKSAPRGMPISCFLNFVDDSLAGIGEHWIENMFLASRGGGIGGHWSGVRSDGASTSKGSQSNGIIPFLKVVDSEMGAVSQGKTRRGSYATFLDISHPEIEEFITMRKPTGGDINRKCLNLHHGVCITDEFMELIEKCYENPEQDDTWALIDPNSGNVTKYVSAKKLYEEILETRMATGEPYIVYIDNVRKALPTGYIVHDLKVHGSNLCVEITLATDADRTAVCCVSSPNLATFDEWEQDPVFLDDLTEYLDNVLEYFIRNAPKEAWRAIKSAQEERSIGIGAMGFHTFLQKKNIPFDGVMAKSWNERIFRHMQEETYSASERLAELRGEPLICEGTGVRNAHRMAIAPNATSSLILGGVSPGIEPLRANAFLQKTLSGSMLVKNPVLEELLEEKGKNTSEVWNSITTRKGSVAHLDCLTDYEKDVFATAMEIPQTWVIAHAADRTPYICQSQSVNIFLPPDIDRASLFNLHFMAWKLGIKTLYYLRSESVKRAEIVSTKIERKNMYHFQEETCLSCEG